MEILVEMFVEFSIAIFINGEMNDETLQNIDKCGIFLIPGKF